LAKIFQDIGFIEDWGTGFQRMVKRCITKGNLMSELKEIRGPFIMKFTRRPAGEGTNKGINEGISGGTDGAAKEETNRLLEFIRRIPAREGVISTRH
jgi:predicted HTH transcriptional regulator